MKLLISGGTGFFGKAILRNLQTSFLLNTQDHPDEVVVLSRSPENFLRKNSEFSGLHWLHFRRANVVQPETLPWTEQFTHILHAAADSTDAAQLSFLRRNDQIVAGTRNMLELAVATGASRFLLTSSGGVYGPQPQHLAGIPETYHGIPDPLNVNNVYSLAKRHAEHLCALFTQHHGIDTVIARCFAFVGEDLALDAHFAVGNFIRDALHRDEIIVGGDGTPIRSYMHQQDLADWLMYLLQHGNAGEAYNVGADEAITIADLACLVRDIIAPQKIVKILSQAVADNPTRNRYVPDVTKSLQLGLRAPILLREAITRTVTELKRRQQTT